MADSKLKVRRRLRILVSGITGVGKSTLVNSIVGVQLAKEGHSAAKPETREVKQYSATKDDVDVTIFDSPGLYDGVVDDETYLGYMQKPECQQIDLNLYCVKMPGTKTKADSHAISTLSKAFGMDDLWRNSVFVLTFANEVKPPPHLESSKTKLEALEERLKEWKDILQEELVKSGISAEVAESVPVVPAGHYSLPFLPDRNQEDPKPWLSALWWQCLEKTNPSAQPSLLKINQARIQGPEIFVEEEVRKQEGHLQPIVVTERDRGIYNSIRGDIDDVKEKVDGLAQLLWRVLDIVGGSSDPEPHNHDPTPADCGTTLVFSPSMDPDQLIQWLRQEHGDKYQQDIQLVKDTLVNGEYFLGLPEDEELLEGNKLSPAFEKWIKELRESTGKADGEAPIENNNRTHIRLCFSADIVGPDDTKSKVQGGGSSAWAPKDVVWKGRKELGVKFLNVIPQQWTYAGSGMNVGNIMSWANEWHLRGGGTIPKFTWVQGANAPSDIRVLFTDDGSRKSLIGKRAESTKHDEATMWLDLLHIGCGGDDYKKHVVIHEFGHALGLGHEHQRSDFWKLIERYINIEEMKKDPGLSNEPLSFQTNWGSDQESIKGECTTYDPNSIMHYWFKTNWLKNGYSDKSNVEKDRDSGVLPPDVAEALLGVHLCSSIPLADKPSDMDIQLLKDLYGNTSCTTPSTQPNILQRPKNGPGDIGDTSTMSSNPDKPVEEMEPLELGQWLRTQYGAEYQEEIDKLKDALINGELFLDLPDDEEILESLKHVSRAFVKLVMKKAKELKLGKSVNKSTAQLSSSQDSGDHTEDR